MTRDANGYAIRMQCEWTTTEDPYRALIRITQKSDADSGLYLSMTAVLSAMGPQQSPLQVRHSSAETEYAAVAQGQRCDVSMLDVDIEAQRVWGALNCVSLPNRDGTEECQATEGYFYFEHCTLRQ